MSASLLLSLSSVLFPDWFYRVVAAARIFPFLSKIAPRSRVLVTVRASGSVTSMIRAYFVIRMPEQSMRIPLKKIIRFLEIK